MSILRISLTDGISHNLYLDTKLKFIDELIKRGLDPKEFNNYR